MNYKQFFGELDYMINQRRYHYNYALNRVYNMNKKDTMLSGLEKKIQPKLDFLRRAWLK